MFAAYSVKDESNLLESTKSEEAISWLKNTSFIDSKTSVATSSGTQAQTSSLNSAEKSDNHLESTIKEGISIANEVIGADKKSKKNSESSRKKRKKEEKQKKVDKEFHKKKIKVNTKSVINVLPEPDVSKIGRKCIFSNGLQLKLGESFYEDMKGNKDNFAFPNMYFKHVAR
jgi:hypothetical protein